MVLSQKRLYWHRMGYKPKNIEPGSYPFPRKQLPVAGLQSYDERTQGKFLISNSIRLDSRISSEQPIEPVNIGFKFDPPKRVQRSSRKPELESLARRRQLKVSVEQVHSPEEDLEMPLRKYNAALHYGIFKDLFGPLAYFTPVLDIPIFYSLENTSEVVPVCSGNQITAQVSQSEPLVDFSHLPKNSLWTLIMTCPDEPFSESDAAVPNEYIHWMISNIDPNIDSTSGGTSGTNSGGDLIVDYLPPLPYSGTGFHRYVFILYRQDNGPVDFSNEMRGPIRE